MLAESARARLRTHGLKGLIVKVRSTQSNGRYVLAEVQAISRAGILQLQAPGFVAEMAHSHVSDSDLTSSEASALAPAGITTAEACERWQLLHLLEFVHDAIAQRRARCRAVAAEAEGGDSNPNPNPNQIPNPNPNPNPYPNPNPKP